MVLKKSKFGANTGNTLRRDPKCYETILRRASYISKSVGRPSIEHHHGSIKCQVDDGSLACGTNLKYSVNKKNRWEFSEHLEASVNLKKTDMENSVGMKLPLQCKKGKKINIRAFDSDRNQTATRDPRIVLSEKLPEELYLSTNWCRRVIDTSQKRLCLKAKTWKGIKRNLIKNEGEVDISYEVESAPAYYGWPYHHESNKHVQIKRMEKKHSKNRSKSRITTKTRWKKSLDSDNLNCLYVGSFNDNNIDIEELDNDTPDHLGNALVAQSINSKFCILDFHKIDKQRKCSKTHRKAKKLKLTELQMQSNIFTGINNYTSQEVQVFPKGSVIYVDSLPTLISNVSNKPSDSNNKTDHVEDSSILKEVLKTKTENMFFSVKSRQLILEHLRSKFGSAYLEGNSSSQCFAICIGQCSPLKVVLTEKGCWTSTVLVFSVCSPETCDLQLDSMQQGEWIKGRVLAEDQLAETTFYDVLNYHKSLCGQVCFDTLMDDFVSKYYALRSQMRVRHFKKKVKPTVDFSSIISKFSKWSCTEVNKDLLFTSAVFGKSMKMHGNDDMKAEIKLHKNISLDTECFICLKLFTFNGYTSLNQCAHLFCNTCWSTYICAKVEEGLLEVQCPETECKNIVDIVTILNFLSNAQAINYMKRIFETYVSSQRLIKWCRHCETLFSLPSDDVYSFEKRTFLKQSLQSPLQDTPIIQCRCGHTSCFSCEDNFHWPLSCSAYKMHKVTTAADVKYYLDSNGNPYTTEVEVKECPSCKMKINKNLGCNHMFCRCGTSFCWNCLQLTSQHKAELCKVVKTEKFVFSSLDLTSVSHRQKSFLLTLQYTALYRQWVRLKKKIKLPHLSSFDVTSCSNNQQPLLEMGHCDILSQVFILAFNVVHILEHLAVARLYMKSKNTSGTIAAMCSRFEFILARQKYEIERGLFGHYNLKKIVQFNDRLNTCLLYLNQLRLPKASISL